MDADQPASPDNPPINQDATQDASLPDPFHATDVSSLDKSIPATPPSKPSSRKSSILSALRDKTTSRNGSNASTQDPGSPGEPSSRKSSKLDASSKDKSGTSIQEQSNLDASRGPGSPEQPSSRNASTMDKTSVQSSTSGKLATPPEPTGPEVRVTSATPTSSHLSLEVASSDISQWDLTPYQFNCPLLPQDIEKDYNELGSIQLPEYYQLVDHTLATVFKCISNGRRDVHKLQPDQILWALKMIEAHQIAERDMASENVRLLKQLLGEIVISMCAGGIPEKRPSMGLPRPEGLQDESLEESFTLGRLPIRRDVSELPSKTIPPAAASTPMPHLEETINSTLPSVLDKSMIISTPSERSESYLEVRTPPPESSFPLHTSTPIRRSPEQPAKQLDLREGLRQIHELFSEYKSNRLERNEGDKLNLLAIERLLIEMGASVPTC